jgi:4-hydroxy-tetrahydrodipicolinate synthase
LKLSPTTSGTFAIAPTPFHPDGRIDHASIEAMTDFYLEVGCAGITVLGIMGEAPKLEAQEAVDVACRMIRRAAGAPIIVGVSAPGFAAMRALTHSVMAAGAAGVMIAPVPSLRTDEQIVGYFRQAVEATGPEVPWVLQDYPLTLTVQMTPGVIRRIIEDNPSCQMLKHEDWPGLDKITALRGFQKDGSMRPVSILTGNGALFLDFEMERGADGAMTGYAFPDMLVDVVRLAREGRREAAHDLFDAHLPLIRYEQQQGVGLAVRKYVMMRRGIIASDAQRKPASSLSAPGKAEVDYLLSRLARGACAGVVTSCPGRGAARSAKRAVVRRRTGTFAHSELGTTPGRRRNAYALRLAREKRDLTSSLGRGARRPCGRRCGC